MKWSITRRRGALEDVHLSIAETDPQQRYIIGRRGMTMWSSGELVAIYLQTVGPLATAVRVDSRRVITTQAFAHDYTTEVLFALRERLDRVRVIMPAVAAPASGGEALPPIAVPR